jgi:hypothetical protein
MLPKSVSNPLISLGLLIIAASCAPLVPLSHVDGSTASQTQSIETDEATVWLRYMKSQNGYMVFDLEIANHSPYDMPIAPQLVSFYASSEIFAPPHTGQDIHKLSAPNSELTMDRQFAADPYSIEEFYIEKAKSKKVGAGIFMALALGVMAYDIAKDSDSGSKEITTRSEINSFGRDVMVTAAFAAADVAKASASQTAEESHYLPYELFPECTIKPGGSMRGKLFLPRESSYRFVRVVVPLSDTDYVFDFRRSKQ